MPVPSAPPLALSEDQIDDILYSARAGDVAEFVETLSSIAPANPAAILNAARDVNSGNSCAHFAAANGHLQIIEHIIGLCKNHLPDQTCEVLLAPRNGAGSTPLHYAAVNGHVDVAEVLTKAFSDVPDGAAGAVLTRKEYVGLKNNAGRDALEEAQSSGKDGWESVVGFILSVTQDAGEPPEDVKEHPGEEAIEGEPVSTKHQGQGATDKATEALDKLDVND